MTKDRRHHIATRTEKSFVLALEYFERALDEELAEAHVSLGWIDYNECRWRESEASFRRALDLDPDYGTGLVGYGLLLNTLGRHDEAVAAAE